MSGVNIDALEIEIKSNSDSAGDGLLALEDSLKRVRDATRGGLGLASVARSIKGLGEALETIDSNSISKIKGIGQAVQTLSGLKVSSSIGNQITNINTALSGLNVGNGADKITDLVNALRPLETLGRSSLGTTVNALKKLPEALNAIDTHKLYNQISSLTRIMQPLADEMQKIANGFNAFPSRIQKLITKNGRLSSSNKTVTNSYTELYSKLRIAYTSIKMFANTLGKLIYKSAQYNEVVNRFNVTMGKYAQEHYEYAQLLSDTVGIDPAEWMDAESTLMSIATGFGIAKDRAALMSKQMTQLGYDIKAFKDNISIEDAMLKIQSGFAGELEPLRRIGYDLSVARLQQEAYTLGINKKVSAMTQAEKAELRYYAIMTQVTDSHGEMAKQINEPANQLAVFKSQVEMAGRSIGNIFIPLLNLALPYLIAFTKIVRAGADAIAWLFGYELPEIKDWDGLASGADDYSDALGDAADNAKKLKKEAMGFDELNILNTKDSASALNSNGFDFKLPEYNFLEKYDGSKVEEILSNLKLSVKDIFFDWEELTGEQIAKKVVTGLMMLGGALIGFSMGGVGGALLGMTIGAGLGLIIGAMDINNDGELSTDEIMKIVEDSLLVAGAGIGLKLGGWQGGLLGFTIGLSLKLGITSISSMLEEGVNPQNATQLIFSVLGTVGGIIGAIKLFNTKHKSPLGDFDTAGKTIENTSTGTSVLTGKLKTLFINLGIGIGIMAEVAIIAGLFVGTIWGVGELLQEVADAWQPIIDNGETVNIALVNGTSLIGTIGAVSYALGSTGGATVGYLALGTAALALIGVNTGLFVAEIWGIGVLLQQVIDAWTPVLKNKETVVTALTEGMGMMATIGTITGLLGAAGSYVIPALALGAAALALIGVNTGLFLKGVKDMAKPLGKIATAWKPILSKGDTIEKAIDKGTEVLIEVGTLSAALGVATVATAVILPIAIGIGAAMLGELTWAFEEFCDNLIDVSTKLSDDLHPALVTLNAIMPTLNTNMESYSAFMKKFAEMTVDFTKNTAISGFEATVTSIVQFFTKDPIKALSNDVKKQYDHASELKSNLDLANPVLSYVISGLSLYKERIASIKTTVNGIDTSDMATEVFTNMATASSKLRSFGESMRHYYESVSGIKTDTLNEINRCFNSIISSAIRIKNEVDTNKIETFTDTIKELGDAIKNLPKSKEVIVKAIYQNIGDPNGGYSYSGAYASGGFPNTGELFVAREAGAEMVGSIGRKTAVANNDQIVSAVSSGVAKAVGSVMGDRQESSSTDKGTIRLRGRDLVYVADRAHRKMGTIVSNNFKFGGI